MNTTNHSPRSKPPQITDASALLTEKMAERKRERATAPAATSPTTALSAAQPASLINAKPVGSNMVNKQSATPRTTLPSTSTAAPPPSLDKAKPMMANGASFSLVQQQTSQARVPDGSNSLVDLASIKQDPMYLRKTHSETHKSFIGLQKEAAELREESGKKRVRIDGEEGEKPAKRIKVDQTRSSVSEKGGAAKAELKDEAKETSPAGVPTTITTSALSHKQYLLPIEPEFGPALAARKRKSSGSRNADAEVISAAEENEIDISISDLLRDVASSTIAAAIHPSRPAPSNSAPSKPALSNFDRLFGGKLSKLSGRNAGKIRTQRLVTRKERYPIVHKGTPLPPTKDEAEFRKIIAAPTTTHPHRVKCRTGKISRKQPEDGKLVWLESERLAIIKIYEEMRAQNTPKTQDEIASMYNEMMRGVLQKAGELTVGKAELQEHRIAPVRTKAAIPHIPVRADIYVSRGWWNKIPTHSGLSSVDDGGQMRVAEELGVPVVGK